MYQVIVWSNNGERLVIEVSTEISALKEAKNKRTINNRTVKVAHAGQSYFHWSRTLNSTRNHWSARAVCDEYLV